MFLPGGLPTHYTDAELDLVEDEINLILEDLLPHFGERGFSFASIGIFGDVRKRRPEVAEVRVLTALVRMAKRGALEIKWYDPRTKSYLPDAAPPFLAHCRTTYPRWREYMECRRPMGAVPPLSATACHVLLAMAKLGRTATQDEIGTEAKPNQSESTVGRILRQELRPAGLSAPHPAGGEYLTEAGRARAAQMQPVET